jgi:hypothetical protein
LSGLLRSDGGCDRMKDGLYLFTRALSIPQIAAQSLESSALIIKVIMPMLLEIQLMARTTISIVSLRTLPIQYTSIAFQLRQHKMVSLLCNFVCILYLG